MKCPGCAVGALPGAPARVAEPDATSTGLDATSHPLRRLPTRCDDFPSVRADIYPVYGICNRPNEWEVVLTDDKPSHPGGWSRCVKIGLRCGQAPPAMSRAQLRWVYFRSVTPNR